ncbi:hypothetical protein E3P78_00570 [Wallemia ichthyophaga]|nr:hypothetical protein E3P78_00570 [Wallemia ichthyophaga]
MKLFFISSSSYILYLIKIRFRPTLDPSIDTFSLPYLIIPAAILSLIFNYADEKAWLSEVLWSFSIYLESVAILPQLFLLQRTGEAETITTHYLFALGAYRALYIPNWIYRYATESFVDPIAIISGLIQTALYADFFYIYFTKFNFNFAVGFLLPASEGGVEMSQANESKESKQSNKTLKSLFTKASHSAIKRSSLPVSIGRNKGAVNQGMSQSVTRKNINQGDFRVLPHPSHSNSQESFACMGGDVNAVKITHSPAVPKRTTSLNDSVLPIPKRNVGNRIHRSHPRHNQSHPQSHRNTQPSNINQFEQKHNQQHTQSPQSAPQLQDIKATFERMKLYLASRDNAGNSGDSRDSGGSGDVIPTPVTCEYASAETGLSDSIKTPTQLSVAVEESGSGSDAGDVSDVIDESHSHSHLDSLSFLPRSFSTNAVSMAHTAHTGHTNDLPLSSHHSPLKRPGALVEMKTSTPQSKQKDKENEEQVQVDERLKQKQKVKHDDKDINKQKRMSLPVASHTKYNNSDGVSRSHGNMYTPIYQSHPHNHTAHTAHTRPLTYPSLSHLDSRSACVAAQCIGDGANTGNTGNVINPSNTLNSFNTANSARSSLCSVNSASSPAQTLYSAHSGHNTNNTQNIQNANNAMFRSPQTTADVVTPTTSISGNGSGSMGRSMSMNGAMSASHSGETFGNAVNTVNTVNTNRQTHTHPHLHRMARADLFKLVVDAQSELGALKSRYALEKNALEGQLSDTLEELSGMAKLVRAQAVLLEGVAHEHQREHDHSHTPTHSHSHSPNDTPTPTQSHSHSQPLSHSQMRQFMAEQHAFIAYQNTLLEGCECSNSNTTPDQSVVLHNTTQLLHNKSNLLGDVTAPFIQTKQTKKAANEQEQEQSYVYGYNHSNLSNLSNSTLSTFTSDTDAPNTFNTFNTFNTLSNDMDSSVHDENGLWTLGLDDDAKRALDA